MRLFCPSRLSPGVKLSRGLLSVVLVAGLAGCQSVQSLGIAKPKTIPVEYRQKVGLYVHDKPERFFYPGSSTTDISDLMAFHMQQVLPFTTEGVLKEIFTGVEQKEPGPQVVFKSQDLVGYFEIKTVNLRYDFPDTGAYNYRADVELLVEFKTLEHEPVWRAIFQGEGVGFSNRDVNLSPFGREAATAVEDAFHNAIDSMQEALLKSPSLRQYFRIRQKTHPAQPEQASSPHP